MPATQLSTSILSAGANYKAGNWGSAGAGASLDLDLSAKLKRGFDVEVGAEALASIEGALHRFIALDLTGEAHATARVRAQVQMPLDLFSEFGLAARFEAIAEVAASVDLAVGLLVHDFLMLADRDPRLQGIGAALLRVLLEEATIQGGVKAKIAASAMAYAGLSITGTLVASGSAAPGFTIAAQAGLGLEVGAGYRMFARFGIEEPRRLIRRAIDITVDDALTELVRAAPAADRTLLLQIATPAKIAFRVCLETGFALAQTAQFDKAAAAELAQRCVQVALEEAQRSILEALHQAGEERFRAGLASAAIPGQLWLKLRPQRLALARALRALPDNPFDADGAGTVRDAWRAVFEAAVELVHRAAVQHEPLADLAEPLAQLWAATELLLSCVERVSVASARASVLGLPPSKVARAFTGPIPDPPKLIIDTMRTALGQGTPPQLTREHLVEYLLRPAATEALLVERPELSPLIALFSDRRIADAGILALIFENANALPVDGQVSPEAALSMLLSNLRPFVNDMLARDVRPALERSLANAPKWVRPYVQDVILPTLDYGVNTVMTIIADAVRQRAVQPAQLREACSCIVFQLLARALTVSADVLSNHALDSVGGALRELGEHANDRGGPVELLAKRTGIDRPLLAEIVEETLAIAAGVFEPLPTNQRARIRDLCYRALDVAPAAAGTDLLGDLAKDAFIPNAGASYALVLELGEIVVARMSRAFALMIERAPGLALEALGDIIESLEKLAREWLGEIEALGRELTARLRALETELKRRLAEAKEAWERSAGNALALLRELDRRDAQVSLRKALSDAAFEPAGLVLSAHDLYKPLPEPGRRLARKALAEAVDALLDNEAADTIFKHVARDSDGFLEALRALDPKKDLAGQVMELLLDRLENAVTGGFGRRPRMTLAIDFHFLIPIHIPLGRVDLPVDRLTAAIRSGARSIGPIRQAVDRLARDLAASFDLDALVGKTVGGLDEAREAWARVERDLADRRLVDPAIAILSPAPGTSLRRSRGDAPVAAEIMLSGVPRAFLTEEAGRPRRVFAWVNQDPIDIASAAVTQDRGDDRSARSRTGTIAQNARAGRASDAPALRLRLRLPVRSLVSGVNTLTVAAVDGASRRCSASAAFLIPEAAGPRESRPGAARPTETGS